MEARLFYTNSPLTVFITTSLWLMAMAWVGFQVGRRAGRGGGDLSQVGTIQASVLGLLALMLGFTFGAASARYDMRRIEAVDEANAVGTTFMRAQTLPEPYRTDISAMLRTYVDLRVRTASILDRPDALARQRRETENLQQAMWRKAAAAVKKYPSDITGLFEESLNESIDLYSTRIASYKARVPETILWVLAMIAAASLGIVGYGFGFVDRRSWLVMGLVAVIVAAVIVMIVDLDRPEAGPTRVSDQGMIDLKGSLSGFELKGP